METKRIEENGDGMKESDKKLSYNGSMGSGFAAGAVRKRELVQSEEWYNRKSRRRWRSCRGIWQ